jgi:hypothetical protein
MITLELRWIDFRMKGDKGRVGSSARVKGLTLVQVRRMGALEQAISSMGSASRSKNAL